MDPLAPRPDLARIAATFDRLRADPPAVHVITSPVAAERTANTLLALGVRPSLTVDPGEIAAFVAASDALVVNLGMLDPIRNEAITVATAAAARLGRPWLLDPVFADVSPPRRQRTLDLLAHEPTAFKANAREAALARSAPDDTVTVITGPTDRITHAGRSLSLANGDPLAARVTAMGCALGAVIAACLARAENPFDAAAAAVLAYGIAAEQAAARATGPGSFAVAFYDCLAALDGDTLVRKGRLA